MFWATGFWADGFWADDFWVGLSQSSSTIDGRLANPAFFRLVRRRVLARRRG